MGVKYTEAYLLAEVLKYWDLEFICRNDDVELPGSPERTAYRWLWQDATGGKWILEGCSAGRESLRCQQAARLDFLRRTGLPVLYFRPVKSGEYGVGNDGIFWQLRPWADGIELPRETYGQEEWRGVKAADFLCGLRNAVPEDMPLFQGQRFSLKEYIHDIMHVFHHRRPPLCQDLQPVLEALQGFLEEYDRLPERFCHGDYHPLNIIWGNGKISSVIDWEFSGRKIEIYDAANLLGCLGMDNPEFLTGGMLRGFMKQAAAAGLYTDEAWEYLPECIVALRFAWMREWVYRKQLPMICQELDFMNLMADNFQLLKQRWKEYRLEG